MKGSLTVEASYIYPFCFVIIGIVCLLGIYLYNCAVLKLTGYECVVQIMEEREEGEVIFREDLIRRAEQAARDRTFGIGNLETSLKITASKLSLTFRCIQSGIRVPIKVTVVYERTFPEMTLRIMKGLTAD